MSKICEWVHSEKNYQKGVSRKKFSWRFKPEHYQRWERFGECRQSQ